MSARTAPTPRNTNDPVLKRRAQIEDLCSLGKRVGYLLIFIACIAFAWGLIGSFNSINTTIAGVALGSSCVVMPPAIVFAYGVKSTNREERRAAAAGH